MKDGFVRSPWYAADQGCGPRFNAVRRIAAARGAAKAGAKLVVLPELSSRLHLRGSLLSGRLLAAARRLKRFKEESGGAGALFFVGLPVRVGGLLYNCAAAVARGRVLGLVPKTFLPNYNEFLRAPPLLRPRRPRTGRATWVRRAPCPSGAKLLFAADAPVSNAETSISLTALPFRNSGVSARILPFSATRLCPANTMSVEDSPSPASA